MSRWGSDKAFVFLEPHLHFIGTARQKTRRRMTEEKQKMHAERLAARRRGLHRMRNYRVKPCGSPSRQLFFSSRQLFFFELTACPETANITASTSFFHSS